MEVLGRITKSFLKKQKLSFSCWRTYLANTDVQDISVCYLKKAIINFYSLCSFLNSIIVKATAFEA
jgi:hypothetical protein